MIMMKRVMMRMIVKEEEAVVDVRLGMSKGSAAITSITRIRYVCKAGAALVLALRERFSREFWKALQSSIAL